ncbi:MAG TPA: hypothetical protein PKC99_01965 [Anaerolineales bacterium]|jgi:hypothetical protein|nr:hypothetical protein [Chloroflexota bacterium]RJP49561.1 MAG: hypothetical protein C4583_12160 [Anaerolineaceae bacterium]WKZ55478.1 MAG: hypothetical protein QY324_05485 [Anaerolineales bacterium]HAX69139.1 hypothetical protein [Anaerolineae bacterium]HMM97747.1 hypothetical protein [Anaerolineales bacterium]
MKGGWVSDDGDDLAFSVGDVWRFACLRIDVYWRYLFRLENVPARQWMGSMSELNVLIDQMVLDIGTHVFQLDDPRLRMFLNWLAAHSGSMKVLAGNVLDMDIAVLRGTDLQEGFKSALKTWLESLPAQGMLWEYRTISFEIAWWRNLDPVRLKMIVESETGQ